MEMPALVNFMVTEVITVGCLYQDDVVDMAIKSESENLLRENSDGNLVLGLPLLNSFKESTLDNVVWVNAGKYWRLRVTEDEAGRNARG